MDGWRHALVVANDQYVDPGLRALVAPAQDAAALAEALADPAIGGFDVRVLHNESAQTIRLAVEDFFADRAPGDLLLLHFSCHGLKNAAGELFLAVADTRPNRLASTAVAADFVNRQMADSRAQRIALFLDCCYGGAFPRGMVVRAAGEAQVRDAFAGQESVGGGRGRVVVTASSAMEYAFEGAHLATDRRPSPSVFTSAVVDGLTTGEADRDGDGWVGLTELVGYVTDRVHRVTPNQNPQMWTFGAQGELLIAHSRVRRITPTPLPPELIEAMDSPLTATRFGVVDDLRERLRDQDLGQAYASWRALQGMVDDDSRKVSESARRCLGEAVPRVSPEVLDIGTVPPAGSAVGELRLTGPPIALAAVAATPTSWLRVEQDGPTVRVIAEPTEPGSAEGSVVIRGPTGEQSVPVRVHVVGPEASPEAPVGLPPPTAQLTDGTQSPARREPAAAAPEPPATPPSTRGAPRLIAGAVAVCALLLMYVNWRDVIPGAKLWYDSYEGSPELYRQWYDGTLFASLVALAAALVSPVSGQLAAYGLGVAAGVGALFATSGTVILGGGLAYESGVFAWSASLALGAAMVGLVAVEWWRRRGPRPRFRRPDLLSRAMLVVGFFVLLATQFVRGDSGYSAATFIAGLAVLFPIVAAGLAGLAMAITTGADARRIAIGAAASYVLLLTLASVYPVANDTTPNYFRWMILGHLIVLGGLGTAMLRRHHGPTAVQTNERSDST